MIEFEDSIRSLRPEDITTEYIEKCILYTSFVLDLECPSITFVIDDDGYIDVIPSDNELVNCAYHLLCPFGQRGLPNGFKNLLIEDIQDYNDFKVMIYEEYPELEFDIQDIYSALIEYTEEDMFSSDHITDDFYKDDEEGED